MAYMGNLVQRGAPVSSYFILRNFEDQGLIGTWSWTIETNDLVWSPGLRTILGLTDNGEYASFELFRGLIHPDDRADFADPFALVDSGVIADSTFRIIRRDGALRWLRSRGHVIHDRDGLATHLFGTVLDVTAEETAKSLARSRERALTSVAAAIDVHVWQYAADGAAVDCSFSRGLGLTAEEVKGWGRLKTVHPDDREAVRGAWAKAIRTLAPFQATFRVRIASGSIRQVWSRGVPFFGHGRQLEGWIGAIAFHDAFGDAPLMRGSTSGGPISSHQLRAARAVLDWTGRELADAADVSFSTVRRAEEDGTTTIRVESLAAIRTAMEKAGIEFGQFLGGDEGLRWSTEQLVPAVPCPVAKV